VLYWTIGGAFIIMDITNKPSFMRKYKTHPEANVPLDMKKFLKGSVRVLMNQTVVAIPVTLFFYKLGTKYSSIPELRMTTSFPKLIFDLFIMGIVFEIAYYYIHRLMHHPTLYKRIHKIHHEWTMPVAAMNFYTHWFGLFPV
jgi:fatty acid hydroxylase domain-containing protein 2